MLGGIFVQIFTGMTTLIIFNDFCRWMKLLTLSLIDNIGCTYCTFSLEIDHGCDNWYDAIILVILCIFTFYLIESGYSMLYFSHVLLSWSSLVLKKGVEDLTWR